MARGLLGRDSSIQFRHCRKEALKGADVVLLVGKSLMLALGMNDVMIRQTQERSVIFGWVTAKFCPESRK